MGSVEAVEEMMEWKSILEVRGGEEPEWEHVYTGSGLENTFVVEHLKRSTKYDARVTVMFEKFDDGEACHELSFTTANAYQCTYKSDMDENGVLFYIGTKGRSQQYESPTGRGVIVTTSPEPSKGDVSMLIGRTLEHCRLPGEPGSTVTISLGRGRTVIPSFYSIRHDAERGYVLRDWILWAQMVDEEWIVLSTHEADQTFSDTKKGEVYSWELDKGIVKERDCIAFRIQMVGPNSENNHELHMSGFEVYGALIDDYDVLLEFDALSSAAAVVPAEPSAEVPDMVVQDSEEVLVDVFVEPFHNDDEPEAAE